MPQGEELRLVREVLEQERREHLAHMADEAREMQLWQMRIEEMQQQAAMMMPAQVEAMNPEAEGLLEEPAPPVQRESRKERKKREEREKAFRKTQEQAILVERLEASQDTFMNRSLMADGWEMDDEKLRREKEIRDGKLKMTSLAEKARLLEAGEDTSEYDKLEIMWGEQAKRASIWRDYARMLPIGSSARKNAMERKEEEEIKADELRKRLRVLRIDNAEEREREEQTLARHAKYDALKGVFRHDNPFSHEDSTYIIHRGEDQEDLHLVNVGRAFFGGTKPMYIFEDRNAPIFRDDEIVGYEQYLFKEAVNCIGFPKPGGALVTAAAAKLQEKICGPYSIPAYVAKHDGKVVGSFQKKIETAQDGPDLFKWQANPQGEENQPTPEMKNEILREHTLDWLLCNFDTKGENFLHRQEDGHLCSFDKEASFSKISDPRAAHMSTEYRPHANDTLYNVLFREYAEGRQALNLGSVVTQIQKAEQITDREYLMMFEDMLTQKYGRESKRNTERIRAERMILARKVELREEYRRFFTDLVIRRRDTLAQRQAEQERGAAENIANAANEEERRQYMQELDEIRQTFAALDDAAIWLDERGQFRFPEE